MRLSKYICFYRFDNCSYLFNTLNKSILQIDKSTENRLKNNMNNLSNSEKNYLENLEYIVDNDYDKYDRALSNLDIINKAHKRLELTILITNNCNCNCYYCYEKEMFSNFTTFDMLTELDKFLRDASKFYDEEIHVSFHGGEPALCPENIISVYNIVSKYYKKTYTSIVTNGTLCGDEKVLRTLKIITPDIVLITIDGPKEVHDKRRPLKNGNSSFDRIMYGIKKLKEIKIIPEISINLDKNNMTELNEWYNLIKDIEISSFNISRVVSGEKHIVDSCLSLKEFRGIVNDFII